MPLDDFTTFNALLDERFEEQFSHIFDNSNQEEKYFLTIHKYCLRKKYVSCLRKDARINFIKRFLYRGFVKFDSYHFLSFKIFCNVTMYFFIAPLFALKKLSIHSKIQLWQAYPSNENENLGEAVYYPGTLQHFFKYRYKIESFFAARHILCGLRSIKLPRMSFVKSVSKIFSGKQSDFCFSASIIIFYTLYHVCNGMFSKDHDRISAHYTYGAVVAPQKIFALHFLKRRKESCVISHGNFHDPQCTYQPASKFINLADVQSNAEMGCADYFLGDELLNPSLPIPHKVRECSYESLTNILSEQLIFTNKAARILIFSSTYDCGIGRDRYFGIVDIIRLLLDHGYKNLEIKLHPSESKFFFKLLYFAQFRSFANLVKPASDYSDFDMAFGMPSTFICDLVNVPKIYVYSPLEYVNYDFIHGTKVEYFSEIA